MPKMNNLVARERQFIDSGSDADEDDSQREKDMFDELAFDKVVAQRHQNFEES